jgi:hypothetical protein
VTLSRRANGEAPALRLATGGGSVVQSLDITQAAKLSGRGLIPCDPWANTR